MFRQTVAALVVAECSLDAVYPVCFAVSNVAIELIVLVFALTSMDLYVELVAAMTDAINMEFGNYLIKFKIDKKFKIENIEWVNIKSYL